METLMRSVPLLAAVLAVAACSSAGTRSPTPQVPESRQGLFRFSERIDGGRSQSVTLDGEFTVTGDSVTVQLMSANCLYNMTSNRTGPIVYDCGDTRLAFNRDDPVNRSTYTMRLRISEPRQVCARYETDAQGRRRCVDMRTEIVESTVTRSGRLNARPGG